MEDKRKVITEYLTGPRDYREGVALYQRYGVNLMLKRRFSLDETAVSRDMLFDELRKIAGLTEYEFNALPRRVKPKQDFSKAVKDSEADIESILMDLADSFGVSVDELVSADFQNRVLEMDENADRVAELREELEEAWSKYAEAPEPVKKMIRFREKYPFLSSPDCPDILKVLVSDMFTAYGNYKTAFSRLQELGDSDSAQAADECETIVTEYLKNREIWEELEHYRINGTILGKAAKFREMKSAEDLSALSDVELMAKLNSASVNVSKHKKRLDTAKAKGAETEKAAAAYEMWQTKKSLLKEEVERRKKKPLTV